MKVVKGGVTKTKGFKANGLHCGIKKNGKFDLALLYSQKPVTTAGVLTKNSLKAAPLRVTAKHLRNNQAQAIIINSGNANCFTGDFGVTYARRTVELIADLLKIKTNDVLVASTGVIGKALPFKKIAKKTDDLVKGLRTTGGQDAAKGILTTDTVTKEIAVEFFLEGKKVSIGACAKGSGMIAPNMATMLAFVTTDAAISPKMLKGALRASVAKSFNNITVDGCMSTNDMVIIMANGLARNKKITTTGENFKKFCGALDFICLDLAKKIVLDGEGATKFITILVSGAPNYATAQKIGLAIADSNLVKTAAYGCNPNWGRVVGAIGATGVKVKENDLKIKFSSFAKRNISIDVDLNMGKHEATVYTSDLSTQYVKINAEYS